MEELLRICEQGSVPELQEFLVNNPVDVNAVSGKERLDAGLQVAAANGHEHSVAFLLGLGADANGANVYGWTSLMQASRHGHTATALLLLRQGAKPDAKNRLGVTALTCAVRSGHVATVRVILDCGVRWSECDRNLRVQVTPVMVAAELGHDPIMRLLLDAGFSVNRSSFSTGVTPLMMAAVNGHLRTAQILIERGADVSAVTQSGRTVLDVAVAGKRRQVRCFLEQKMLEIKLQGRLDEVQAALSKNRMTFTECRSVDGVTPLMFAAQIGDSAIVEFLLEIGAKLDSTDVTGGWTALMFALFQGHNEIALRLMQAGANVNVRAHGGFVAFDIATVIGTVKPELIKLLAKETAEKFLHPLANILRQDDPHVRSSRSMSLCKTFGRFWFPKLKQGTESNYTLATDDSSATKPLGPASSMPLISMKQPTFGAKQSPIRTCVSFISPDSLNSDPGSNVRIPLPIISASPCSSAVSKSPVRPTPPLLPSMGLDSSIAAGNVNMSLNLPFSQGASAFTDGNMSSKSSANTTDSIVNPKFAEINKSMEEQTGELSAILKKYSLEHYAFVFDKEEVDLETFKVLTNGDLLNLNIEDTSIRNRLLQVIATFNH